MPHSTQSPPEEPTMESIVKQFPPVQTGQLQTGQLQTIIVRVVIEVFHQMDIKAANIVGEPLNSKETAELIKNLVEGVQRKNPRRPGAKQKKFKITPKALMSKLVSVIAEELQVCKVLGDDPDTGVQGDAVLTNDVQSDVASGSNVQTSNAQTNDVQTNDVQGDIAPGDVPGNVVQTSDAQTNNVQGDIVQSQGDVVKDGDIHATVQATPQSSLTADDIGIFSPEGRGSDAKHKTFVNVFAFTDNLRDLATVHGEEVVKRLYHLGLGNEAQVWLNQELTAHEKTSLDAGSLCDFMGALEKRFGKPVHKAARELGRTYALGDVARGEDICAFTEKVFDNARACNMPLETRLRLVWGFFDDDIKHHLRAPDATTTQAKFLAYLDKSKGNLKKCADVKYRRARRNEEEDQCRGRSAKRRCSEDRS